MKYTTAHAYDPITKEYSGTAKALEDPKHPGRYLIPAFATEIEPPEHTEHSESQKVVWDGQAWQFVDISEPELEPKPTEEELRQREIWQLEGLLNERYSAHAKLLVTGADQAEIDECRAEIQIILAQLEVLYRE